MENIEDMKAVSQFTTENNNGIKELPRDMQLSVARFLDIDTRRALGIFTKLRVPPKLAHIIGLSLIRPLKQNMATITHPVSTLWVMLPFIENIKDREKLLNNLDQHPSYEPSMRRTLHTIKSFISGMVQFPKQGLVINAGIVDSILYIGVGVPEEEENESMFLILNKWMTPAHMNMWKM